MGQAFERLERVIELEAKQGYKNKAVVGGIRQFAIFWAEQAREESADEGDHFFIDLVSEMLANYHRLPGTEARAQMLTTLLTKLKERNKRGESAESQRLPVPAPPTKPTPDPAQKKVVPQKVAPLPVQKAPSTPVAEQPRPMPHSLQISYNPDPEKLKSPAQMLKGISPKTGELL